MEACSCESWNHIVDEMMASGLGDDAIVPTNPTTICRYTLPVQVPSCSVLPEV